MAELFPPSWFASGIVTAECAADFARYARAAPHHSVRHWLWTAFRDWSEERVPLTAEQCREAFALGESTLDENLGTAMMCHILYQRRCPSDVREAAKRSGRAPVRRTADMRAA